MSDDHTYHEEVARLARDMARSGRYREVFQIEAALIIQGYSVEFLQESWMRADLQMLLEDNENKH